MVWYCLKCGRKNPKDATECSKCKLDKASALSYPVLKRLFMCEECGHRHREGVYCHVYTEAADGELIDDVLSESEEEEESDSSDDSYGPSPIIRSGKLSPTKSAKRQPKIKKSFKQVPLSTPPFVKAIRYIRCNCKEGVPAECPRYEPLPKMLMVDIIHIQTYAEVMDPNEKTRFLMQLASRRVDTATSKRRRDEENQLSNCIPRILSYLHFGQCSEVPKVCRSWRYGASLYPEYVDMRSFVPWMVSYL